MTLTLLSRRARLGRVLAVAVAAPLLVLTACGSGGSDALKGGSGGSSSGGGGNVVIAYQDYTEMSIMAQMYAALLKNAGYQPTLKGVSDRSIYAGELESGKVDVAPEYASSMTEYLNREANGPNAAQVASPDINKTIAKLKELGSKKNMTPLDPAQAEDANAFAVTEKFSTDKGVRSLSDLGKLGEPVSVAAAPDCPDRPDCKLGLQSVYGVKVGKFEPLGFGTTQTKNALTSGEVQVGQVGTSDGQIQQLKLVVLQDDKNWQNAENLVPVVNTKFLDAHSDVKAILNKLSKVLTTDDLMKLNAQVDAERQLPQDVANKYLSDKGLI